MIKKNAVTIKKCAWKWKRNGNNYDLMVNKNQQTLKKTLNNF